MVDMTSAKLRLTSALVAGALAVSLAACGQDDDKEPVAADPGGEPSASDTSASDSPTDPATTDDGGQAGTTTVPVYFVSDTPRGPALFREFRQVPDDNPLEEAAALVTAGDTVDPDYSTLYPAGEPPAVEYSADAGAFVVELADEGWSEPAPGMSRAEARLAVQQLVYTLQGVQQERAPVVVQHEGSAVPLFGVDTADGVEQADPLSVLGLVNVTTPEQGATVSGTFTAEGVASSFEGTVPWEVRQGDSVVKEGFATASGWMDKLYPWQTEIDVSDLEPGEYTFVARTDDPSGGEGFGPTEDTKTFTVR